MTNIADKVYDTIQFLKVAVPFTLKYGIFAYALVMFLIGNLFVYFHGVNFLKAIQNPEGVSALQVETVVQK